MKRQILLLVAVLLLVSACRPEPLPANPDKLVIAATFYPLGEIARSVAGEEATVFTIVPAGVEPHDFEPTSRDIVAFQQADVFVTLGLGFSDMERTLLDSRDKAPLVVLTSEGIVLIGSDESDEAGFDSHIWLSPKNMMAMTRATEQSLSAAFPEKASLFQSNAQMYITRLDKLDAEYEYGLADCSRRSILVNHRSFSYLARDYGLEQLSVSGASPEVEPTPGAFRKLVELARAHNITYVFAETLVDPRVAQTIADEIGAQTLVLDPVEGSSSPNDTYEAIMRRNLLNLRTALDCR